MSRPCERTLRAALRSSSNVSMNRSSRTAGAERVNVRWSGNRNDARLIAGVSAWSDDETLTARAAASRESVPARA